MASGELLLFYRELREERVLIALNMGPEPIAVSFPEEGVSGRVLLSAFQTRGGRGERQFRFTRQRRVADKIGLGSARQLGTYRNIERSMNC